MKETEYKNKLVSMLKSSHAHAFRVETPFAKGIADMHYAMHGKSMWIEGKWKDTPKGGWESLSFDQARAAYLTEKQDDFFCKMQYAGLPLAIVVFPKDAQKRTPVNSRVCGVYTSSPKNDGRRIQRSKSCEFLDVPYWLALAMHPLGEL